MELAMKPSIGSRQLRTGRVSIENQAYFVTTAVHERTPVFVNPEAAGIVLEALKWLDQAGRIKLDAAIVMPDHLHFIAALKDGELPRLMQSLKGYSARRINALLATKGVFWQNQYHEHAIRKDEALNQVVLYMLNNPVRAGMVGDFHDYPFWWCRWAV
jgi:REP element-mobilizing transposase RayT